MLALGFLVGPVPTALPSARVLGALAYLTFIGSLLAFSAYGYLLRTTSPVVATSYAYVNPVVALALGALLGGEALSGDKLGACALTLAGVLVVTLGPTLRARLERRRRS
jgi:drug/metabolite transporter (DMT)-like permease